MSTHENTKYIELVQKYPFFVKMRIENWKL